MSDASKIEWCDATWNPFVGCSLKSPGCTHCYAMPLAHRFASNPATSHYKGLTKVVNGRPVWTGKIALAPDHILTAPLRWRKPRRVFVNSMGDLFHEDAPDEWIDRCFAVMALCPQHVFQVLTKRSERMREYFAARQSGDPWAEAADYIADLLGVDEHPAVLEPRGMPLSNVWLGASVEDQARLTRIDSLRNTPAAVRFLSLEPLLEDLGEIDLTGIRWVIVGGESGPGARPMHPTWARAVRDQCQAAGVPFFFKQWGEWAAEPLVGKAHGCFIGDRFTTDIPWNPGGVREGATCMARVGKKAAGRLLDGREWSEYPA